MIRINVLVLMMVFSCLTELDAQKGLKYDKNPIFTETDHISCPFHGKFMGLHVQEVIDKQSPYKNNDITFHVEYRGDPPADLINAMEEKVFPILEATFSSPVDINMTVNWDQTMGGTIASASPNGLIANVEPYVTIANVFYPLPLAEKIARRELNDPDAPDLNINVGSNQPWCFTCDTPQELGSRFDFVTIILHEIYHGLGFLALSSVEDDIASQTINFLTSIYNYHLELRNGDRTIVLSDESEDLLNHFQSNNLFFNLPSAGRAKVFAPSTYSPGSSIAHLDQTVFTNTDNALMTPNASFGSIIRSGGLADEMMYDMGWVYTYLIHEPNDPTIERATDEDCVISLEVISDNGFVGDSLQLHYSFDEFENEDNLGTLTKISENNYEGVIPAPNAIASAAYFIEVVDNRGLRFSNPGININQVQLFNTCSFGADTIRPIISHIPVTSIKSVETGIDIIANVNDDFVGVEEVRIEWRLNGVVQSSVIMELDTTDLFENDRYNGSIILPSAQTAEDIIEYRIIAIDASSNSNMTFSPTEGFYNISVEGTNASVIRYVNDFDDNINDFEGEGFSLVQPSGFLNFAVHSEHPYENAGNNRTLNLTYELVFPIILDEPGKAKMTFEEIVLVEPGEFGVPFGETEFWDYVIVEGKKIGENRWRPFLEGYDSRDDVDWLRAYNNGIPSGGQDSDANGTPSLFREREIDLLESGEFSSGDEVFIRFRLFSDPFARGWGWSIDDLMIQDQSTPVSDFVVNEEIVISPIPTNNTLNLSFLLEKNIDVLNVEILSLSGKKMLSQEFSNPRNSFDQNFDVSNLANGPYVARIIFDKKESVSMKFLIQR